VGWCRRLDEKNCHLSPLPSDGDPVVSVGVSKVSANTLVSIGYGANLERERLRKGRRGREDLWSGEVTACDLWSMEAYAVSGNNLFYICGCSMVGMDDEKPRRRSNVRPVGV